MINKLKKQKNADLKHETQNTRCVDVLEPRTPSTPLRTLTQTTHHSTLTVLTQPCLVVRVSDY
jgi:hypothetical protein